ncbi:Nicotinate phosphoribosyltransferase [Giardia muris]|uniref:nicotinate phosphoribosyltransferase n=1 Tax=Giardia muris TaxID=5742 RepID=A0A4Z1SS04_GIAMU|nr:Nicotinate phosphoribosyltransferase [Giardia muris]|eukprot:TNJ26428.1 Nicotinate phosphoribosyltransferase [Giardia muris]
MADATPLVSDTYQYTMAYSYFKSGIATKTATFEMFFRACPFKGEYAVFAGLGRLLDFLLTFHFTADDIAFLKIVIPHAEDAFFDHLQNLSWRDLRVWAPREGTIVFAHEPILIINGPLLLCQLIETTLLVLVNYSTLICTNACRFRVACIYQQLVLRPPGPPAAQKMDETITELLTGKILLELGLRRAQGVNGGIAASEYAIMGGFNGTSNIFTAKKIGLVPVGTMAHSFILSMMHPPAELLNSIDEQTFGQSPVGALGSFRNFAERCLHWRGILCASRDEPAMKQKLIRRTDLEGDSSGDHLPLYPAYLGNESELSAFIIYAYTHPHSFTALLDTYDPLNSGLMNFLIVACTMLEAGISPTGVRLDSGDLAYLSQKVRTTFNKCIKLVTPILANIGKLAECRIVVSGDIDIELLMGLMKEGTAIDTFGVGTNLVTCREQPSLGGVYKLVELDGVPRVKLSEGGKATIPGAKRVYRLYTHTGVPFVDVLACPTEEIHVGEKILCIHPHDESSGFMIMPSRVLPLHECVFNNGVINYPHRVTEKGIVLEHPSVLTVQRYVMAQILEMRPDYLRHGAPTPYKVSLTEQMSSRRKQVVMENRVLSLIE